MSALLSARLQLFRTLCLPSVLSQSTQHFIWLIWIDDGLLSWAIDDLSAAIKPMPNARLVWTSNASEFKWSPIEQLRHAGEWPPIGLPKQTLPQQRLLQLSTRLDADDALPLDGIASLTSALTHMLRSKPKRLPWYACWESYLSWQPSAANPSGIMYSEAQTFCVSAGLSKISRNKRAPSVYAHRHAFPKGNSGNRPVKSLFAGSLIQMNEQRVEGKSPLRARSVTSDSMLHVHTSHASPNRSLAPLPAKQMSSLLHSAFNLSLQQLHACNTYMIANESQIAHSKENEMPSQCFKGFACKKHAKQEEMVLRSGRWVTLEQAANWARRGIMN
ncbi:MAG: hypothetical protein SGPRY_003363 [Prymnesium sp.]